MTHLCVTHETWLIHMCQSYEWHYTEMRQEMNESRNMTHSYVIFGTWLIYVWRSYELQYTKTRHDMNESRNMTHSYVSVIWMALHEDTLALRAHDTRYTTHYMWCLRHDSFICDICDRMHSYVIFVTWFIYMWHARHDSFICVSHMNDTTRRHHSLAQTQRVRDVFISDMWNTSNSTWGDIFEGSKLKARFLFCQVSVKRDFRALSFELWNSIRNCHPKWDWHMGHVTYQWCMSH